MKSAPLIPNNDKLNSILKAIRDEELEIDDIKEIFNLAGAVLNRAQDAQIKMVLFRQFNKGSLENDFSL